MGDMTADPFAGLDHESPHAPGELIQEFLRDTKRDFAKMRKIGIQLPKGSKTRHSMLPHLVRAGKALDAWLMTLALEPILSEADPLPIDVWAELLGGAVPISETATSRAFATLERLRLIERNSKAKGLVVRPLKEDGSGDPYTRPGSVRGEPGPGFFTIPHSFWLDGHATKMGTPGKIALLIGLAETTQYTSWEVATTKAQEWYGVSERTLERGYRELAKQNLLLVHGQRIRAKRAAGGMTMIYHRALKDPFSTEARHAAQAKAGEDVLAAMQRKKN